MAKVARQTKTTIQKLLLEGTATDVLQNSCSKEFCKAHRKTSSSGSLFNKGAGWTCNFIKKETLVQRTLGTKYSRIDQVKFVEDSP